MTNNYGQSLYLLSVIYKIFVKVLLNRIPNILQEEQLLEQINQVLRQKFVEIRLHRSSEDIPSRNKTSYKSNGWRKETTVVFFYSETISFSDQNEYCLGRWLEEQFGMSYSQRTVCINRRAIDSLTIEF